VTPVQTVDPFDVRYATRSSGALAEFNRAGVLSGADLHVANTLGRLGGESDGRVLLAIALAVRAVRLGSVCIDVRQLRETIAADTEEYVDPGTLPWPEPAEWHASCQAQPAAVGVDGEPDRPVRLVDDLLYLDRYWRQEHLVRASITVVLVDYGS